MPEVNLYRRVSMDRSLALLPYQALPTNALPRVLPAPHIIAAPVKPIASLSTLVEPLPQPRTPDAVALCLAESRGRFLVAARHAQRLARQGLDEDRIAQAMVDAAKCSEDHNDHCKAGVPIDVDVQDLRRKLQADLTALLFIWGEEDDSRFRELDAIRKRLGALTADPNKFMPLEFYCELANWLQPDELQALMDASRIPGIAPAALRDAKAQSQFVSMPPAVRKAKERFEQSPAHTHMLAVNKAALIRALLAVPRTRGMELDLHSDEVQAQLAVMKGCLKDVFVKMTAAAQALEQSPQDPGCIKKLELTRAQFSWLEKGAFFAMKRSFRDALENFIRADRDEPPVHLMQAGVADEAVPRVLLKQTLVDEADDLLLLTELRISTAAAQCQDLATACDEQPEDAVLSRSLQDARTELSQLKTLAAMCHYTRMM